MMHRRSYYAINDQITIDPQQIQEIVESAVKYVPSAFNSQTGRVVILLGGEHQKLWDLTKSTLLERIWTEDFPATEEKLNAFAAGYGTLLFFEDQSIIRHLEEQFVSYQANFQPWSLQSSGMLQFAIWTMLEDAGLGASVQHYNPLIDQAVADTRKIDPDWKLISQMPFGNPIAEPGKKEFIPLDERILIYQ